GQAVRAAQQAPRLRHLSQRSAGTPRRRRPRGPGGPPVPGWTPRLGRRGRPAAHQRRAAHAPASPPALRPAARLRRSRRRRRRPAGAYLALAWGAAYNPRYPERQVVLGVPMNLDDWRSRINDLDNRILQLLNQRAEAALKIGDLKRRQEAPAYAPEREAEIFRRLTEAAAGPLSAEAILTVWREILSAYRALDSAL